MVFVEFDERDFPIVRVKFNGSVRTDEDFLAFTNGWEELYERGEKFIFMFDTTNMGFMGPKYCFRMSTFIRKLKRRDTQFLQRSIIYVNSRWTKFLLWLIFKLQSPVAPVYITNIEDMDTLNDDLESGISHNPKFVELIEP